MKAVTAKLLNKGRNSDYRTGYQDGYRLGLCEAVRRLNPVQAAARRPIKLMYVPQGFDSIDIGVTEALRELVAELVISTPEAMLETASNERPGAVLVMNGLHVFPPDHLEQIAGIRALGIPTAVWFVDDPYFTEDTSVISKHYDHVFTHELGCISFYRDLGVASVHYLPLCVNPNMFYPRRTDPGHQYDIVFIGNAFRNRTELIDRLSPFLKKRKTLIVGGFWERLTTYDEMAPFIRGELIPPTETARFYSGAKLVINIHRPWEGGHDNRNTFQLPSRSINPRTYEIAACGTMQLTDVREDLGRYYRPGYDLETFASAEELLVKMKYYLEHEEERRRYALRSLRTTLRNHTFTARMPQLLDVLAGPATN